MENRQDPLQLLIITNHISLFTPEIVTILRGGGLEKEPRIRDGKIPGGILPSQDTSLPCKTELIKPPQGKAEDGREYMGKLSPALPSGTALINCEFYYYSQHLKLDLQKLSG